MNKGIKAVVGEFLFKHGMHYETINMRDNTVAFAKQMEAGLAGAQSSLLMIPSYIYMLDASLSNEEVIVIDAGGTNLRIGTVCSGNGNLEILKLYKHPMPGTRGALDKEQFFNELADYLEPVINHSSKIGFCFSFPTEILPNGDGRIIGFNKEVCVESATGSVLGENLNRVLVARGKRPKRFVVLNDTVATMLGGLSSQNRVYDSYVGYILGTGTNTCYMEKCENITKAPSIRAKNGYMAINMESGGYDGFIQGDFDIEIDRESNNPGDHKMEKMISGAYQGTLIYKTVCAAVKEGLFSAAFSGRLRKQSNFTLADIDRFVADTDGDNTLSALADSVTDRETLLEIIDASFERSARITAINYAAILAHCGYGTNPEAPTCITAEGSNFTKSILFRPKLDAYLKDFINGEMKRYCHITTVEDVTLRGTATAALIL